MSSKILIIVIAASAILSALLTVVLLGPDRTSLDNSTITKLSERVSQLEAQVIQVRELGQQQLAQRSLDNREQAKAASVIAEPSETENQTAPLDSQTQQANQAFDFEQFRQQRRALSLPEARKRRLISAGFTDEEANWIFQNESDVQLQSLYADHEIQRQALQANGGEQSKTTAERLRESIGDETYERYLQANNRSTKISVSNILSSSPAENSGLKAGDRIIGYAGERVFNVRDLNKLTVQGEAGESVLLEIERDGEPIQLTIPRGPIGINSDRRR